MKTYMNIIGIGEIPSYIFFSGIGFLIATSFVILKCMKTEYNIKSSRATATHIKYKLYSILKDKYTGNIDKDLELYEKAINDEKIFNSLIQNEHDRWNAYMRSDGYRRASIEEVGKYRNWINDYRHHLAKLHPAIDNYENLTKIGEAIGKDLIEPDVKIIKNVSKILK